MCTILVLLYEDYSELHAKELHSGNLSNRLLQTGIKAARKKLNIYICIATFMEEVQQYQQDIVDGSDLVLVLLKTAMLVWYLITTLKIARQFICMCMLSYKRVWIHLN
jgi:hypothetical protein